ncbi:MAG: hypothetical protein EOP06_03415 [Proteobacteria bacterium]|nr:MAG: hypothetical protein EOP06_03415 [Pseudomonadota bacterium]
MFKPSKLIFKIVMAAIALSISFAQNASAAQADGNCKIRFKVAGTRDTRCDATDPYCDTIGSLVDSTVEDCVALFKATVSTRQADPQYCSNEIYMKYSSPTLGVTLRTDARTNHCGQ